MYNFKEFFKKNYDFSVLLEAYRGSYPKQPLLYDDEDLDFLYQLDQTDWSGALEYRYRMTWRALRKRQEIRNKIIREMLSAVKRSEFIKTTEVKTSKGETRKSYKIYINRSNVDQFKKLIIDLGKSYDNYGDKSEAVDPKELSERKHWLDRLFDEYDIENLYTRGAKDNQRAIKDIIYEIIKRIVIYVKGGDNETYSFGGKNIKLYLNRLIQKLETTTDEEHHIKSKLENLSEIYGKDIYFEKTGKYGFDLSNPRIEKSVVTKRGKTTTQSNYRTGSGESGYIFPKRGAIDRSLYNLYGLNYHRHLGELPTDDPNHQHDIVYKIIRTGGVEGKDQITYEVLKTALSNNIKKFLIAHRNLDWYSDLDALLDRSIDPENEKEKMLSGVWFIRDMLGNDSAKEEDSIKIDPKKIKKIFHYPKNLYKDEIEPLLDNGKIGRKALQWITSYRNVANNIELRNRFSDYFGELRASDIIRSKSAYGPKILSVDITGDPEKDAEIRKKEIEKLDDKDKKELMKILGDEDWEKFVKTGRLPYKIVGQTIKIGEAESDPPVVLPHIKKGEGKDAIYFPLLKAGKYLRHIGISFEKDEEIKKLQNNIKNSLENLEIDSTKYDLSSIKDLEELNNFLEIEKLTTIQEKVQNLISALKAKEAEQSRILTTSRSSSVIGPSGEETPIIKFHKTDKYLHGRKGTKLAGTRAGAESLEPGSLAEKATKIGLAKIFPKNEIVMGPNAEVLVDDKVWDFFKRNPEQYPEKVNPMRLIGYDISNDRNIGQVENNNWQKNINLNNFYIIKEDSEDYESENYEDSEDDSDDDSDDFDKDYDSNIEDEEKSPKTSKKRYRHRSKIGNTYWTIEESESGTPSITGYRDIVLGMSDTLFGMAAGGHDVQEVVKDYYLQPENFQRVHDNIVKIFWNNAKDVQLHYAKTRRERASYEMGKILQRKDPEIETSIARKRRTGFEEIEKSRETFKSTDLKLSDIQPRSIEKDKDLFIDIFLDFENPIKIQDTSGRRVYLTVNFNGVKSYSFRGYNKEIFAEYLTNRSNIFMFTRDNLHKINEGNISDIVGMLDAERNNFTKYWKEIFGKIKESSEKQIALSDEAKNYFEESNVRTLDAINKIYDKEISTVEKQAKKSPIETSSSGFEGDETISGIIEINKIIDDLSSLIEEIPNFKIRKPVSDVKKAATLSVKELRSIQSLMHKEDKDLPGVVNWFNTIVGLLTSLQYEVIHEAGGLTLLQFIAIEKGGLSPKLDSIKGSVDTFLNRIDSNIQHFLRVVSDKIKENPNYLNQLTTKNTGKNQMIKNFKANYTALSPKLPSLINSYRLNLINQLKKYYGSTAV